MILTEVLGFLLDFCDVFRLLMLFLYDLFQVVFSAYAGLLLFLVELWLTEPLSLLLLLQLRLT